MREIRARTVSWTPLPWRGHRIVGAIVSPVFRWATAMSRRWWRAKV